MDVYVVEMTWTLTRFSLFFSMFYLDVNRFAPQVRVVDGRIELDLDSLTVDHATVDGIEQGPIEYVDESSTSKFVNSATYSNKFRSEKWSEDETELFYKVTFLHISGEVDQELRFFLFVSGKTRA